MDRIVKIAALFAVIALAITLLGFLPQKKELDIRNFSFASFVDPNLSYIPNTGYFRRSENIYFVFELANLEARDGNVSYKVDAEITNISGETPEKTFEQTILEETRPVDNNRRIVSVAGKVNAAFGARLGTNRLKITVKDKFSGTTGAIEEAFSVVEWEKQIID